MTANEAIASRPFFGLTSFAFGAAALILVLVHFWAGPFAAKPRVTVTIGEVAADIRQAAIRKLKGLPNPPAAPAAPAAWDGDRILKAIAACLAGLAVVAGVASFVRQEVWRPGAGGIALGAGAVAFQFFTWAVLVLACAILLYAIIQNIDGILGG
ncbi:MAG: hypothetical protein R3D67_08265 [Hyphomicrobiaceae bacterium]